MKGRKGVREERGERRREEEMKGGKEEGVKSGIKFGRNR